MSTIDAALLATLRAACVHLPAGQLATDLATTTPAIRERVAELRSAGFEIEERPDLGYRLIASPDRLVADDVRARLGESGLIRDILVFAKTDSTNDRAAQLGANGAAGGVAIFAEHQTAGRGRFGRPWHSASNLGLWCSVLLRPPLPISEWPRLTTWAAVAIAAALERAVGVAAQIKWPNDVEIHGRKVAGVLIETGVDGAQAPFAVLGFGVNVNHTADDFAPDLRNKAGSLGMVTGRPLDRTELAVIIFRELDLRLPALKEAFHELVSEAARRSTLLGKWIRVRAGALVVEGLAEELDSRGQLVLRESEGGLHRLTAGAVTILGPKKPE